MPIEEYDIAVIGGGPAGLLASKEAAKVGCRVLVVEEDDYIGRPEKCAGLYSLRGLSLLGLKPERYYTQNLVKGAVFKSPSGYSFTVDVGNPVALVANRERFDQFLACKAIEAGSEIMLRSRATDVLEFKNKVSINLSKGLKVNARFVIDAEGRNCTISRKLWNDVNFSHGWLPIVQCVINNHGLDKDYVYLFFKPYLRDFFGYLVPIDEYVGKLGVASSSNIIRVLRKFISEEFPRCKLIGISSSSIYTGVPYNLSGYRNVFPVGDVAGHVKATTGGGVIYGGMAARAAGKLIAKSISEEDGYALKAYDEFIKLLNKRLKLIHKLSYIFKMMDCNTIDKLFKSIRESSLDEELSKKGDMDFQWETFTSILGSLKFSSFGLRMIANSLKGLIDNLKKAVSLKQKG